MDIEKAIEEMQGAFDAIQMPRKSYTLEHFVVGQEDNEAMRYHQCVLELQIKYDNIRRAQLQRKKMLIEIERLESCDDDIQLIEAQIKRIDLEVQDRALLGAMREFKALFDIWQSFEHKYTHEEIEAAQEDYWHKRLNRQATLDVLAHGRVGVGNADALRMIGQRIIPDDRLTLYDLEKKLLGDGA